MQHDTLVQTPSARNIRALVARLVGQAAITWHRFRQQRRLRSTTRLLSGLDERTLKDIGIDRSEIDSIVRLHGDDRWPRRLDPDRRKL